MLHPTVDGTATAAPGSKAVGSPTGSHSSSSHVRKGFASNTSRVLQAPVTSGVADPAHRMLEFGLMQQRVGHTNTQQAKVLFEACNGNGNDNILLVAGRTKNHPVSGQ